MSAHLEIPRADYKALSGSLWQRWAELCREYLPLRPEGSIWRYSRGLLPGDPEQGWKLHVPATVLTACEVLSAVGPLLKSRGVLYKATATLDELDKLNSGIHYGYSQVGKFLTVYPRTDEEAVRLARGLHRLTRGMEAPSVPFDLLYREGGCVHYRYGAFQALGFEDGAGEHVIRDPGGRLVPDLRDSAEQPAWVADPFARRRLRRPRAAAESPLKTTYRVFRALAQRGRGGVYQALDVSAAGPRLCVLKEGRRAGEMGLDGRDGFWRVRHEARVLEALTAAGIEAPQPYGSFEAEGNYYVAAEFIEGHSLDALLSRRQRRLPLAAALRCGAALARLVARLHEAGWVWRDCKPGNVVVTEGGALRPLDFEGACRVESPDPLPWGTPAFAPPEGGAEFRGQSRLPEDLYALGAVVYFLIAGRTPESPEPVPLGKMRRGVPESASKVVAELLDRDPSRRPQAAEAARRLEGAVLSPKPRRGVRASG